MIELKPHNGSEYASAREIHKALKIVKPFTIWWADTVKKAVLFEGDYITIPMPKTGGRRGFDYYLTEELAIGITLIGGKNQDEIRAGIVHAFKFKITMDMIDFYRKIKKVINSV